MGNTLSFNSPDLAGAVSSPGADDPVAALSTSYAFGPTNVNAFGLPATLTAAGTIRHFTLAKAYAYNEQAAMAQLQSKLHLQSQLQQESAVRI